MLQKKKANRPQPHPPHTGGTFHRRLQPIYTEKYKVSCSGFLPKTKPVQHSRPHYNALHGITSQTCTYLRTWQHQMTTIMQPFQGDLQPQIPKHLYKYPRTSTPKAAWSHRYNAAKKKRQTDRSRTRRTQEVPFIAACSHFTRKNTKFRAPASSPKTKPMQYSFSHYNVFRSIPFITSSLRHHFPSSPLPFVTTVPSSPLPFVTTVPSSPLPFVTTSLSQLLCSVQSHTALHQGQFFSDVLLCSVQSHTTLHQGQFLSDVLLCSVKSYTTLHQGQFFSDVLLCSVKSYTTLHQGQFFSDVLLCSVQSHTTLYQGQFLSDVLLCSVKSYTTLHQGQFFSDVLLCSVQSHTTLHQGQFLSDVLLCSVKSYTTLHQGQFFSDVLLCSVQSHTTLHQVKVIRNSEVFFPTSFDN